MIFLKPYCDLTLRRARLFAVALARRIIIERKITMTALQDAALTVALRVADEKPAPTNRAILHAQNGLAGVVSDLFSSTALPYVTTMCCVEDPRNWLRYSSMGAPDSYAPGETTLPDAWIIARAALYDVDGIHQAEQFIAGCFLPAVSDSVPDAIEEALLVYGTSPKGLIAAREAGMLGDLAERLHLYEAAEHLHDRKAHPRGCWAIDALIGPYLTTAGV